MHMAFWAIANATSTPRRSSGCKRGPCYFVAEGPFAITWDTLKSVASVKADTSVFAHAAIARAELSVDKAGLSTAREKLSIRQPRVKGMLSSAVKHADAKQYADLFLVCYVFPLRMPSEALPMIVKGRDTRDDAQSVVWLDVEQELVLKLHRRKNKQFGSRLVRKCWCNECTKACPVHVLGKLVSRNFVSACVCILGDLFLCRWRPRRLVALSFLVSRLPVHSPSSESCWQL